MDLSKLLRRKTAWAIAVYLQPRLAVPPLGLPDYLLSSKRLLRGPRHIHTRADPFLFSDAGKLWLFYETQSADDPGQIEAAEIMEVGLRELGPVLREPFHLSYPYVFRIGSEIYLLPESRAAGATSLYRFLDFPRRPKRVRTLLDGAFSDVSPVKVDDIWFLFATSSAGLELFYANDIVGGEIKRHPASPITTDPRRSRCGGVPFHLNGQLVRPAQNNSERYGGNLSLLRIETINHQQYREASMLEDIFEKRQPWNSEGAHHVSVATWGSHTAVAVDGQAHDYYIHKLISRAWMLATGYQSGR